MRVMLRWIDGMGKEAHVACEADPNETLAQLMARLLKTDREWIELRLENERSSVVDGKEREIGPL